MKTHPISSEPTIKICVVCREISQMTKQWHILPLFFSLRKKAWSKSRCALCAANPTTPSSCPTITIALATPLLMVSVAKGGKELKLAFPQNLKHACSLPYQIMLAQAGTDVIPSMFLLPSNNNL